ncbi:MAG: YfiR family protein [Chitinispirillaceae bacterium]|nr:YfiR family protein [Chitinispirillaceae bacterium]
MKSRTVSPDRYPAGERSHLLIRRWLPVIVILILPCVSSSQIRELPLKALFLEAAVRFITWPPDTGAISSASPQLTIGVFSGDRLIPHVTEAFRQNHIRGQKVRLLTIRNLHDIDSCMILIIPRTQASRLGRYVDYCKNRPILTVCDTPAFVREGVILSIAIENQRISCTLNKHSADAAGLKISHHLLQKASVLDSRGNP